MENPLNYYGPYFPPTFESKKSEGGTDEEKVQEMIDKSLEDVAFIDKQP